MSTCPLCGSTKCPVITFAAELGELWNQRALRTLAVETAAERELVDLGVVDLGGES